MKKENKLIVFEDKKQEEFGIKKNGFIRLSMLLEL